MCVLADSRKKKNGTSGKILRPLTEQGKRINNLSSSTENPRIGLAVVCRINMKSFHVFQSIFYVGTCRMPALTICWWIMIVLVVKMFRSQFIESIKNINLKWKITHTLPNFSRQYLPGTCHRMSQFTMSWVGHSLPWRGSHGGLIWIYEITHNWPWQQIGLGPISFVSAWIGLHADFLAKGLFDLLYPAGCLLSELLFVGYLRAVITRQPAVQRYAIWILEASVDLTHWTYKLFWQ